MELCVLSRMLTGINEIDGDESLAVLDYLFHKLCYYRAGACKHHDGVFTHQFNWTAHHILHELVDNFHIPVASLTVKCDSWFCHCVFLLKGLVI